MNDTTVKVKKNVESIKIYQVYMELICYIEMITNKYPNYAKIGFVSIIKNDLYNGMRYILYAYKAFDKKVKLDYLNDLDIILKMLKVYARVSYKKKYINNKNYEAWSRKVNNVCISLGTWINVCLKR